MGFLAATWFIVNYRGGSHYPRTCKRGLKRCKLTYYNSFVNDFILNPKSRTRLRHHRNEAGKVIVFSELSWDIVSCSNDKKVAACLYFYSLYSI